jgi:hypothetical protein
VVARGGRLIGVWVNDIDWTVLPLDADIGKGGTTTELEDLWPAIEEVAETLIHGEEVDHEKVQAAIDRRGGTDSSRASDLNCNTMSVETTVRCLSRYLQCARNAQAPPCQTRSV